MAQKRGQIGNRLRRAQHFYRAHAHAARRFQINPQIIEEYALIGGQTESVASQLINRRIGFAHTLNRTFNDQFKARHHIGHLPGLFHTARHARIGRIIIAGFDIIGNAGKAVIACFQPVKHDHHFGANIACQKCQNIAARHIMTGGQSLAAKGGVKFISADGAALKARPCIGVRIGCIKGADEIFRQALRRFIAVNASNGLEVMTPPKSQMIAL